MGNAPILKYIEYIMSIYYGYSNNIPQHKNMSIKFYDINFFQDMKLPLIKKQEPVLGNPENMQSSTEEKPTVDSPTDTPLALPENHDQNIKVKQSYFVTFVCRNNSTALFFSGKTHIVETVV